MTSAHSVNLDFARPDFARPDLDPAARVAGELTEAIHAAPPGLASARPRPGDCAPSSAAG
ncbi:MAG: hypothetical protein ABIS86_03195 [Streptosporangiaceae bacterium]